MWSHQREHSLRIKKIAISLIGLLLGLTAESLAESSISKAQNRSEREFSTFCSDIEPSNPLCQRWFELTKERLKVELTLRQSIKQFCNQNSTHPLCKRSSRLTILTYCSEVDPENSYCEKWKTLRQAELEVKGLLAEEIQRFCQSNPTNPFCKSKKK